MGWKKWVKNVFSLHQWSWSNISGLRYSNNNNSQTTMSSEPTKPSKNAVTSLNEVAAISSSISLQEAMDLYRVHELINHHAKSMLSPWHGSINFLIHKWNPWDVMDFIHNGKPESVDIVTYLDWRGGDVERLYFCQNRYSLTSNPKDWNTNACDRSKNLKLIFARQPYLARIQSCAMEAALAKLVK